ncbi:MAG: gas vesicle protein [Hamadaea sp.]|nr:gas vesicle protein [Hamadaea sp.]
MQPYDDPVDQPVVLPPAQTSLVDILDRVLAAGVVITGDVTISIAEVDLIHLSLNALLASAAGVEDPR